MQAKALLGGELKNQFKKAMTKGQIRKKVVIIQKTLSNHTRLLPRSTLIAQKPQLQGRVHSLITSILTLMHPRWMSHNLIPKTLSPQ